MWERVRLTTSGGRKEKTATYNNSTYHITILLVNVGMHYALPVMFHVFPVVRGEKTLQSLARITDAANIFGVCGIGTNRLGGRKKEKQLIPESYYFNEYCCVLILTGGDVLQTFCLVPCVSRSEGDRKHSSH